jgi:NADH-quinone oxidoreductase subunit E
MAWITQKSSTESIERRDAPYLTDEMKAMVETTIIPRYETRHGALMPVLHIIQKEYRWIPPQAMEEIAAFLNITPAEVLDTVSFYEDYHTHKVGENVIGVCQSIACEVCGHQAILDRLRARLGIEPHETTSDGKFTLLAMECLGACDTAPCALVNDQRKDCLTIEEVDRIIDDLEQE